MRLAFFIIVLIHGLIHILGFVKGMGIRDVKELTLSISKPMGLFWLIATIISLLYAVLFYTNYKYAWLFGFITVLISQFLIILFWRDAKIGTVFNIAILLVSIIALGHYNFQRRIQEETAYILNQSKISTEIIITENDIKDLPIPVKKWLRHSGVIGKAFINVGIVTQQAELKMKPDQQDWINASALQYTTVDNPAFIWTMDANMNSLFNFQGRDKFEQGRGEMLIKINSLINVVNEQGEKLNESSMQRYLGEMVWFPSIALSPYISWKQINDTSAIATMDYEGTKGSGTFYFSSDGDFRELSALRYKDNEPNAKRYEWVLLVKDYKIFEGIKVPTKMTLTWKLDEGDWTWLKLEVTDIKYNENISR